jgi:hypothetical protein
MTPDLVLKALQFDPSMKLRALSKSKGKLTAPRKIEGQDAKGSAA